MMLDRKSRGNMSRRGVEDYREDEYHAFLARIRSVFSLTADHCQLSVHVFDILFAMRRRTVVCFLSAGVYPQDEQILKELQTLIPFRRASRRTIAHHLSIHTSI